MALKDYSSTPSANTAISGINIGEGCNASNINDAIRQLMADLAAAVPTRTILTTASVSPYSPPAGVRQLRIRMKAGGGGGGGTEVSGGPGGNGGATSFNAITTNGGVGAVYGSAPARGGTGGAGSPTGIFRIAGASGSLGGKVGSSIITSTYGGTGGGQGGGTSGQDAVANSGGGGGGGALANPGSDNRQAGSGGGEGEYAEFYINAPAANYAFTVGAGGSAGTFAGMGGSGYIIVDEIY